MNHPVASIIRNVNRRTLLKASVASFAAVQMGGRWSAFAQDAPSGTLIEGNTTVPEGLAPVAEANRASRLLFDALVALDPDTGEPLPYLAKEWSISEDGLVYTFFLQDGVVFHDGAPLTAEDVVFTFELLINEDTASNYYSVFAPRISQVTAIDELTVEFTLNMPVASFIVDTAAYAIGILPKHIVGEIEAADFASSAFVTENPVGSGPFKFGEFVPGEAITLVNNPDYFLGTPALENVVLKILRDQTAAYQQLKTGEIDIAQIDPSYFNDAQTQSNFTPVVYDTNKMQMFGYNLDQDHAAACLLDVNVRRALPFAIDRQLIVDRVLNGLGSVAQGAQSPISWAYDPDSLETTYDYDPENAANLLDEAGWLVGNDGIREKDGEKLAFTVIADAANKIDEGIAMAIQEFLAEIGVSATPEFQPSEALWGNLMGHTFHATIISLTFPPDPDQSLIWDSAGINGGYNVFAYDSEEADQLLQAGLATPQIEERKKIYAELDDLLLRDMPAFVMFYSKGVTGVSNRLQNYVPSAVSYGHAPQETAYLWSVQEQD